MHDIHSFNDIHRGVPLVSRAVLVARLRYLEHHGVIERRSRADGAGHEYWLTPAGEELRPVVAALGLWGLSHTRDRIKPTDLDPVLLTWGFRKRALAHMGALSDHRVVVRFDFSGVPASRTKFRVMWLLLERLDVDLICRGNIADFVAVYLGHVAWRAVVGKAISIEGDRQMARQLPVWLRLDKAPGRDFPVVRPAA
jgi:hypothetical protein